MLIAWVTVIPESGAAGLDLHRLWDDRCAECHGHSGEFAREFLSVSNGVLQGPHHVENLRLFMHNHYIVDSEVDAVYDMLLSQAGSQARFKEDCSNCHATAAQFVRQSLEFRSSVLYGTESGHHIRYLLDNHSKVDPDDVEFYMELLSRVAREVYRP